MLKCIAVLDESILYGLVLFVGRMSGRGGKKYFDNSWIQCW